ncbi:hypothetical protein YC2023_015659 [Brassica napus]
MICPVTGEAIACRFIPAPVSSGVASLFSKSKRLQIFHNAQQIHGSVGLDIPDGGRHMMF